jgi:hypothetical protein
MYGFKKGAGHAGRKQFADGGAVEDEAKAARGFGMVRGPGTGTSDDVKDAVPPGTYIMPADSTQQIGPEALGAAGFRPGSKPKAPNIPGMGFGASAQVPVNLSNGEFRLSPEQVHAIGVQVLEGMKAATHTPAGGQGDNDGDDASTRELFFADGGRVDDPNKMRPLATSPTNTYPGNQAERAGNIYAQSNADLARGFGDAFAGTITGTRGAGQAVQDAYRTGGVGAAIGQGVRGSMVPAVGFLDDVARSAARTLDGPAQALKTLATGDASPIGQAQAQPAGQPQAVGAPVAQTPAATTKAGQTAMPPNSGPVPYTVTPVENTNGVQRINQKGQSPLFTNIDPGQAVAEMKGNPVGGFQPASVRGDAAGAAPSGPGLGFGPGSAAGSPDVLGILQRESDIRAGMGSIQDRINFNSGNGVGFRQTEQGERGFTTIRDGAQAERDRAAVMDAALKPLAGARNGQLTANQLRTAQGMVDADQRNEQSRYQTDANAATQLETTGMREAGANNRANASNQIQQGELRLRKEAQGFQSRAAQRQEDLQAKYEAAKTPEERSAIAQQIRDLSGKQEPQNRFTVVPGGQEWDANAGAMRNVPGRVINNQTGLDVERPTQGAGQQPVANHIAALKKNPEQAAMFDSVYGKGAAARYLGAGNGS